jgi:hypothetical protein
VRFKTAFVTTLVLLWVVPSAYSQCQNQICFWNGSCYQCASSDGFACSVRPNLKCSNSCTETFCSSALSASGKCTVSDQALAQFRHPKLLLAQYQSTSASTVFLFRPGTEQEPATIVSTTHNAKQDLLENALIKNQSSSDLTAYRIGWLVFPRTAGAPPIIQQGRLINTPEPIKPGATFEASAQWISPGLLKNTKMIVFFVSEANLSDGTEWRADTAGILSEYQQYQK